MEDIAVAVTSMAKDLPLHTYRLQKYAGVNENGEALYYVDVKGPER